MKSAMPGVNIQRAISVVTMLRTSAQPVSCRTTIRSAIFNTPYFRRPADSSRQIDDSIRHYQNGQRNLEMEPEQR
jgi:homoserine acetyltransferase